MEQMICLKKEQYVICRVSSIPDLYRVRGFSCLTVAGDDITLICEKGSVPDTVVSVNEGWSMFEVRVKPGALAVSGIAGITGILAEKNISAVVQYANGIVYYFVKSSGAKKAIDAFVSAGYPVVQ